MHPTLRSLRGMCRDNCSYGRLGDPRGREKQEPTTTAQSSDMIYVTMILHTGDAFEERKVKFPFAGQLSSNLFRGLTIGSPFKRFLSRAAKFSVILASPAQQYLPNTINFSFRLVVYGRAVH